MSLESFAIWAEATPLGHAARASDWVYPVANLFHLLGLVLLLGPIAIVDVRLLGGFRALPMVALARSLVPVAMGAICLLIASGIVLFLADATALVRSPLFGAKLLLILFAVANALTFEHFWRQRPSISPILKAMAVCSIAAWLTVAALGRLIAYR